MIASTQHHRLRRGRAASAPAHSAEHPNHGRTGQRASQRNRQPQHNDLQRVAMPMRRRLKSVSHTSQHTIDQLEISEAVAKAFDGGKRFHKQFVVHAASHNVLRGYQTTAKSNRTARLLLIRRCIASEQFYEMAVRG